MKSKAKIRNKIRALGEKGTGAAFENGKGGRRDDGIVKRRSDAEKRRRQTLGVELKSQGKRGEFRDERIGENDDAMGEEERLVARLRHEHSKRARRRAVFNLEDGEQELEVLTHGGQAIDEFEDDELEGLDDNDGDDSGGEGGLTSADGVAKLNFGGGLRRKGVAEDGTKSHAEVMAEVIAKSKMHREERAREKQEMESQMEELDKQLPSILLDLQRKTSKGQIGAVQSEGDKFYDTMFVELADEKRSVGVADRLKTPEEVAKEEKERLEALEAKRQRRMHGIEDDGNDGTELGAKDRAGGDDLEDDFAQSEESGDEISDTGEDDDSADHQDRDGDNLASIEDASSENSDEEESEHECAADGKTTKGDDDIPYSFKSCPSTNAALKRLFRRRTAEQKGVIVSRLIKNFAVVLNPTVNRVRLLKLLDLLLERFGVIVTSSEPDSNEIRELLPSVYELAQLAPEKAIEWARAELVRIQARISADGSQFESVGPGGLLALRVISRLFPATDQRHPIVTPALLILGNVFAFSSLKSQRDLILSCFAMSLFHDLLAPAGKVSGEFVRFCASVVAAAAGTSASEDIVLPSHRGGVLELKQLWTASDKEIRLTFNEHLGKSPPDGDYRGVCYRLALKYGLACARSTTDAGNAGAPASFALLEKALHTLEQTRATYLSGELLLPTEESADELARIFLEAKNTRKPLQLYARAVKAPKELNPKLTRNSRLDGADKKQKTRNLKRQVRREERGAGRELRRDASFVGRAKQAELDKKDAARQKKANEAMAFLEKQEQTYKQQERKKKRLSGKW